MGILPEQRKVYFTTGNEGSGMSSTINFVNECREKAIKDKISEHKINIERNNHIIETHTQGIEEEHQRFLKFEKEINKAILKKERENESIREKIQELKQEYNLLINKIPNDNIPANIERFILHIKFTCNDINEALNDLVFIDYMHFMKKNIKTQLDIQILEYEYIKNENYIKQELKKQIRDEEDDDGDEDDDDCPYSLKL